MNDVKRSGWSLRFRSSFPPSAPFTSLHSLPSPIPIPFPTSRRLRRALRAEARRGGMGGDGEVTRNEVRSRVKEITVHRKFPRLALYVHPSLRTEWVRSEGRKERVTTRTTGVTEGWAGWKGKERQWRDRPSRLCFSRSVHPCPSPPVVLSCRVPCPSSLHTSLHPAGGEGGETDRSEGREKGGWTDRERGGMRVTWGGPKGWGRRGSVWDGGETRGEDERRTRRSDKVTNNII